MYKVIIVISIPFLLTACLEERNVCFSDITPTVTLQNHPLLNNNKASLSEINANNSDIYHFKLKYITSFESDNYTSIFFEEDRGLTPSNIYKVKYNDDVYFIYDIKLANSSKYQNCGIDTTYQVNDCKSSGVSLDIDPSCAIPADQADEYFKTNIKPNLN